MPTSLCGPPMNDPCSDTVIAESLAIDKSSVPDSFGQDVLPLMTLSDWCKAQADEPHICQAVGLVGRAAKPSHTAVQNPSEPPEAPFTSVASAGTEKWCNVLQVGRLWQTSVSPGATQTVPEESTRGCA